MTATFSWDGTRRSWHSGGDANHFPRTRVTTHRQPERTQALYDPLGREPQLGVAAGTLGAIWFTALKLKSPQTLASIQHDMDDD
jgi:hypothetical protein